MNMFSLTDRFSDEARGLRLPQFVVPQRLPSFFADSDKTLLTKEALTEGFTLRGKDIEIDFSALDAEIARVDIEDSTEASPRAWMLRGKDNEFYRKWFNSLSSENRIRQCTDIILNQLAKINAINNKDLSDYTRRVIDMLTPEQLEDLQQSPLTYSAKIKSKIDGLLDSHRENVFDLWVEQGKISCEPRHALRESISPVKFTSTIPNSLYTSEEDMNADEREVIWNVVSEGNIRWWHRNISQTGFNINGYVNTFPDFIVMTESGKILMIEPKGWHLDNSDSMHKAKVGRIWQNMANTSGDRFRYYMVFKFDGFKNKDAVSLERLLQIVREL